MTFQRENLYIVLKRKDVERIPTDGQRELHRLCAEAERAMSFSDKPRFNCVVVENDWPEYEAVRSMIMAQVQNEQCQVFENFMRGMRPAPPVWFLIVDTGTTKANVGPFGSEEDAQEYAERGIPISCRVIGVERLVKP